MKSEMKTWGKAIIPLLEKKQEKLLDGTRCFFYSDKMLAILAKNEMRCSYHF